MFHPPPAGSISSSSIAAPRPRFWAFRSSDSSKTFPSRAKRELKAFFTQYAEILPVPNSPTPGFKRPAKAGFNISWPIRDFNDRAMTKVTPEEIREYYEKNKDIRLPRAQARAGAGDRSRRRRKFRTTSPSGRRRPPSSDQPAKTCPGDAER